MPIVSRWSKQAGPTAHIADQPRNNFLPRPRCISPIGLSMICLVLLASCARSIPTPSSTPVRSVVTPISSTPTLMLTDTPIRSSAPPTDCSHYPLGGFNDVWRQPEVYPRLGCAIAPSEAISGTAANLMGLYSRWLGEKRLFLVLLDKERRWRFVPDGSGLPLDAPLMIWPVPESGNQGSAPERVNREPVFESPAPVLLITPAPTPTPGPGTPEVPTATTAPPEPTKTPLPTSPAIPRSTWPRGLFPASGRHEWLVRAALSETQEVIWSGTAETPFNGVLQEFEGGWLFWDSSTCFTLFEDGAFTLCP